MMPGGMQRAAAQRGFTLIEVLIAILVVTFALLGMAALIARSTVGEVEAIQRSQALLLVRDMTERIQLNRVDALNGRYGRTDAVGAVVRDCAAEVTRVARDVCEWGNLLAGTNESQDGRATSALNGARGCVTLAPGATNAYAVTVVWRGMSPTGTIAEGCGPVDGEDRAFLRSVTMLVELGRLDG